MSGGKLHNAHVWWLFDVGIKSIADLVARFARRRNKQLPRKKHSEVGPHQRSDGFRPVITDHTMIRVMTNQSGRSLHRLFYTCCSIQYYVRTSDIPFVGGEVIPRSLPKADLEVPLLSLPISPLCVALVPILIFLGWSLVVPY